MRIFFSYLILVFLLLGCGVDRKEEASFLRNNVDKFDELRVLIENKYSDRIANSGRPRIVFKNCQEFEKSNGDFVCDDFEISSLMEELSIVDIAFERKKCNQNNFSEVYFQMTKAGEYPVIYYLYERCGAGDLFESRDIYYEPINEYWGLYIDSNLL
ncbi:hypothetical protein [Ekhidna sp.]|uniref:hypothetical protein n=1 Tax=Ekhidna sp. TaxID=2608089 RepID=UPI00329A4F4E